LPKEKDPEPYLSFSVLHLIKALDLMATIGPTGPENSVMKYEKVKEQTAL
jgi:hypothetical protein